MMVTCGFVMSLGIFLISSVIAAYFREYIKKNFYIANIVSAKIMSIYLIFCILIALSIGVVFLEITHQAAMLAIALMLLAGVYWFLFLPMYRRWKELLADRIGSSPTNEVNKLRERITSLTRRISMEKEKQDTLSAVALKVDVIYYQQRLESLERSRSAAKFMRIFTIVVPTLSLILEIWIWMRWW